MDYSSKLILENVIRLTRSGEKKFREGNFKGSLEDKRRVNSILKSNSCCEHIIEKFKEELSSLYSSKFDLINDHKLRLDVIKKKKIIKLLEQKCEENFKRGDFKRAVRALRRSEKYLSN